MSLLSVTSMTKSFGGLTALSDLDFSVETGEIVGVIGPNGAGKTTLFNVITGFHNPTRGRVAFDGRNITGFKANRIAALGLVRTWQSVNLVAGRTVLENVRVACHLQYRVGAWGSIFRSRSARREEDAVVGLAKRLLGAAGMSEVIDEPAGSLSHGRQRLLGLCLAMAARPKLLLLDEPAAGMSAAETEAIMDRIKAIRTQGVTVMIVEHDMKVIMNVCDRIIVLNFGRKLAEGTPAQVSSDQAVIRAYLGLAEGDEDYAA